MKIAISKEEVYEAMAKLAGYSAKAEAMASDAADNTFKRNGVFDPYRELLDDVFNDGCNRLTEAVAHVAPYEVGTDKEDYSGYTMKADMPYNWNYALEDEVRETAKRYLVSHMMTMWMRIIENADEDKYFKDSTEQILVFTRLLYRKRRVSRNEFREIQRRRRIGTLPPDTNLDDVTPEMVEPIEDDI